MLSTFHSLSLPLPALSSVCPFSASYSLSHIFHSRADNLFNQKNIFFVLFHRMTLNFSEETSFFIGNSPLLASPLPCPISPCRSDSTPLPMMDDDIIDFENFISEKPYSPARKKLNMDSVASSLPKTTNFLCLRELDENLLTFRISMTPTRVCKRQCEETDSPSSNKRIRSSENTENVSPTSSIFSLQTTPIHRKPVSIMNVLTSSSELLRKNRL